VLNIALTGGIAAGKSLVARRLAELGAVLVDADVLAREVVAPGTPGLDAIRERFGPGVIADDGSLDRAALGAIVFTDADAREALNGITHPAINRRRRELLATLPDDAIVVHDIPLFVETVTEPHKDFQIVLVVHAEEDERIRRMVEDRGMAEAEARGRMAAQATEEQRLAIADVVIDNTGKPADTLRQVDEFWGSITD
jgi:dephospho-CoA kinase